MTYSTNRRTTTNTVTVLLLLAIVLPAIQGCADHNGEKPLAFPITLYAESREATSEVKMYTYDGEITDPNKIEKFIAGMGYFETDALAKDRILLTFTAENRADLSEAPHQDDLPSGFSVTQKKNQLLFVSEREMMISLPFGMHPTDYENFIFKHTYPLTAIPPAPELKYLTRLVRVAYGTYNQLTFPVLAYKVTRGDPAGASYAGMAGLVFSEFNEASVDYLRPNDTVAIRSFNMYAKAKP